MMSQNLKVIFINFQGGMKVTKGYLQYGLYGWKYFLPHDSIALKDVISFINQENPDIVCCVEMENSSLRSRGVSHTKEISKNTELKNYHFFQALKVGTLINQGNVILSRFPLSDFFQKKLPGYGEARYLCEANIHVDDRILKCFVTHLSTNKIVNIAQREYIARSIVDEKMPSILLGDFNTQKDSLNIIKKNTNFDDVDISPTFPSWKPVRKLDHIFVNERVDYKKMICYDDVLLSDHLPIGVDIKFS